MDVTLTSPKIHLKKLDSSPTTQVSYIMNLYYMTKINSVFCKVVNVKFKPIMPNFEF